MSCAGVYHLCLALGFKSPFDPIMSLSSLDALSAPYCPQFLSYFLRKVLLIIGHSLWCLFYSKTCLLNVYHVLSVDLGDIKVREVLFLYQKSLRSRVCHSWGLHVPQGSFKMLHIGLDDDHGWDLGDGHASGPCTSITPGSSGPVSHGVS